MVRSEKGKVVFSQSVHGCPMHGHTLVPLCIAVIIKIIPQKQVIFTFSRQYATKLVEELGLHHLLLHGNNGDFGGQIPKYAKISTVLDRNIGDWYR